MSGESDGGMNGEEQREEEIAVTTHWMTTLVMVLKGEKK